MEKITIEQLTAYMGVVLAVFPNAVVEEDLEGQLVIYTNAELAE